MKKYKIGKRIITADSMIAAVKIAKMLDSPNTRVKSIDSEIDELTQEEQQAVEDYREAIKNTSNPKLLEIYSHILQEETEHLRELAKAKEVDDACGKMKDDRLSPMTYKKLKELGVRPEQWKKWTQEQANEYIRNKRGQGGTKENAKLEKENNGASAEKIQSELSSLVSKLNLYSDVDKQILGEQPIDFVGQSGEPYVYASDKKKAEKLVAKLSELGLKSAKVVHGGYVHFDFDELDKFRTKLGRPSIAQASANFFQKLARDDIEKMLRFKDINKNSAKNVEKVLELIKDKPVSITLKQLYDDEEGGVQITLFKDGPNDRYYSFKLSSDETFESSVKRNLKTEESTNHPQYGRTTSRSSTNNSVAEIIEQLSK